MIRYNSPILDNLFLELGKGAIHYKNNGFKGFKNPKTNITDIDSLIAKYIQFVSNGLNRDFINTEMEMDKIYFNKEKKLETMCLIIIQQAIFKVMEGDIEYIMEFSKRYTGHNVYDELIKIQMELSK